MDNSKIEEDVNIVFFCAYCDCEVKIEEAIPDGDNFYCSDDCLDTSYINEEC